MQVKEINARIKALQNLRKILTTEPINFTELVFLKYIELRKTSVVAEYLNDTGYKTQGVKGDRKYISTDITEILESDEGKEKVRKDIYALAINMKNSRRFLDRFLLELDGEKDS